ncbi:NMT1/THI5 like-domain-containing protein [Entophlyctis helioformis]|nr:NMT1/THI5 like-domain-containing protein [Entophlyctis helioformis]
MTRTDHVSLALDWTPNTNHIGFYIARSKGFYADENLTVSVVSPHEDEYKTTPGARVADRSSTLPSLPRRAWCRTTHGRERPSPRLLPLRRSCRCKVTHAVVTLKSSGIDRPAKLDGKTYASYAARYEGRMVQELIRADGGKGDYIESVPAMLGIWNTLLKGEADATWVFMSWEGIEAARANIDLNVFAFEDFGIPLGYSPVLVAHPDLLASQPDRAAKIFVDAVAADTAHSPLPTPLDAGMVAESARFLAPMYVHEGRGVWGVMEEGVWSAFVDWLSDKGLLTTKVQSRKIGAAGKGMDADKDTTTSLDGLRSGDVGVAIPRESVPASSLFSNEFLL